MSGRVPPSSRAGAKSTIKLSTRKDIQKAADLYERFSGHDAEILGKIKVRALPRVAIGIGIVDEIQYTTVRDGKTEKYRHPFRAADKPILAVSPDGKQILILAGNYRFTELGIVDGSDKKNN